jgi:branched-chain amino acid transport system substrate-binding protein
VVIRRRQFGIKLGMSCAATMLPQWASAQQASKAPIRIGGSLALTGPLSSVGLTHKLTGEIYIEELNKRGGLLGRPVEWVLKDDQSKPDLTRTLYEQLVVSDKVDILIGPYGTAAILSAMGVAQRYGKTLVHHTFGVPHLAKYDQQFPSWALGPEPDKTIPRLVLASLAAAGKTPKTIAVITSKFPSVNFISNGAREVARQMGVREVLFLEWEFGNREFGPIAGASRTPTLTSFSPARWAWRPIRSWKR